MVQVRRHRVACSSTAIASILFVVFILKMLPYVAAELVMRFDGRTYTFPTATYKYIGAPPDIVHTNVSVAKADFDDSCHLESRDRIRGKIALWDGDSAFLCVTSLSDSYVQLERAGALGVVYIPPASVNNMPLGHFHFIHHRINPDKFERRHSEIIFVETIGGLFGSGSPMGSLEELAEDSKIDIHPPHDTRARDLFTSVWWVLMMQIFLPTLAFFTSSVAVAEAVRLWRLIHAQRQLRRIQGPAASNSREDERMNVRAFGFMIAALEAPCLLVMAIILACGQYGPTALPFFWHRSMYLLLPCVSMSTTLLLGLMIRSELKSSTGVDNIGEASRIAGISLLQRRFKVFLILGTTPIALDLSIIFVFNTNPSIFQYASVTVALFWLLQAALGIYFACQAVNLATLLAKVRHLTADSQIMKMRKIQRIVFWLRLTAAGVAVNAGTLVVLYAGQRGAFKSMHDLVYLWFVSTFLFALSRIAIMYGQLQITNPGAETVLVDFCLGFLQHVTCARRLNRVLPYSNHPVERDSESHLRERHGVTRMMCMVKSFCPSSAVRPSVPASIQSGTDISGSDDYIASFVSSSYGASQGPYVRGHADQPTDLGIPPLRFLSLRLLAGLDFERSLSSDSRSDLTSASSATRD